MLLWRFFYPLFGLGASLRAILGVSLAASLMTGFFSRNPDSEGRFQRQPLAVEQGGFATVTIGDQAGAEFRGGGSVIQRTGHEMKAKAEPILAFSDDDQRLQ